jgi:hypothetical protein
MANERSPSAESGRAEILACPFCGGEAFVGADDAGYPEVKCIGECHPADTEAEAIAAWNRRTPDRALLDRIEELEAAVVPLIDQAEHCALGASIKPPRNLGASMHRLVELAAIARKALSGEKKP